MPARMRKGIIPRVTNAVLHSNTKAMINPVISVEMFWRVIETMVVVRPLIWLHSAESLAAKLPLLFLGISKKGMGNLSSLLKTSILIFNVIDSPMILNIPV